MRFIRRKRLLLTLIAVIALVTAMAASPVFGGGGGGGDQGLEKAKQAQEKHTDQLLAKEDVEGTAVGFDGAGGRQ